LNRNFLFKLISLIRGCIVQKLKVTGLLLTYNYVNLLYLTLFTDTVYMSRN